jgi:hypothetical protein
MQLLEAQVMHAFAIFPSPHGFLHVFWQACSNKTSIAQVSIFDGLSTASC